MGTFRRQILPMQTGILVAILATAVLFMGLPLLTQFQKGFRRAERHEGLLISTRRPPPPPEPERDERQMDKPQKKEMKKTTTKTVRATPRIETPSFNLPGASIAGGIRISGLDNKKDFKVDDSRFATAFSLTEVDQKPSVLRAIPPQYPFLAKRKNIEGKVILRFVVDTDGYAQEPQVYSSEPEGVFDEAALNAIKRYKFKPAIKDGKAVDCIVRLPISFSLR